MTLMRATLVPILGMMCACAPTGPRDCTSLPAGFLDANAWPRTGRYPYHPVITQIQITRSGAIMWDGNQLGSDRAALGRLSQYLTQTARMSPLPDVFVAWERGTPCGTVDQVRTVMLQQLDCERSQNCYQGSWLRE